MTVTPGLSRPAQLTALGDGLIPKKPPGHWSWLHSARCPRCRTG
ncbi:hypothetical protein ACIRRH_40015 [Kitasatospora sp. NPDC101235]